MDGVSLVHGYVPGVAFRAGIRCRARPIRTPSLSLRRLDLDSRASEETSIGNYSIRWAPGRLRLALAALKGSGVGAFNLDSSQTALFPVAARRSYSYLPAANRFRTAWAPLRSGMSSFRASRASPRHAKGGYLGVTPCRTREGPMGRNAAFIALRRSSRGRGGSREEQRNGTEYYAVARRRGSVFRQRERRLSTPAGDSIEADMSAHSSGH